MKFPKIFRRDAVGATPAPVEQDRLIMFDCPHCGNHLKVGDKFAGRDGWCRVCKRFIVVPSPDGTGKEFDQLSASEKLTRMNAVLQYAATRAEQYKLLELQYREECEAHRADEAALEMARTSIEQLGNELATAKDYIERLRSTDAAPAAPESPSDAGLRQCIETARAEIELVRQDLAHQRETAAILEKERDALAQRLTVGAQEIAALRNQSAAAAAKFETLEAERHDLLQRLERADAGPVQLQTELDALRTAMAAQTQQNDVLVSDRNQTRQQLEAVQAELAQIKTDFDARNAHSCASDQEHAATRLHLERSQLEVDLLHSRIAELSDAVAAAWPRADLSALDAGALRRIREAEQTEFQDSQQALEATRAELAATRALLEDLQQELAETRQRPAEDESAEAESYPADDGGVSGPDDLEGQKALAVTAEIMRGNAMPADDPMMETYLRFLGPK